MVHKNRVIKFRGIQKVTGNFIYGYGLLQKLNPSNEQDEIIEIFIHTGALSQEEVIMETVSEFTGLQDKNGKDIYEDDGYKSNYYTGTPGEFKRIVGVIKFHGCGFVLEGINKYKGLRVELHRLGEVIGNIYQNPELNGTQE